MKGSRLKIILIVFVLFVGGFIGAYFYAASKISPEEIRKLTLLELQKTFPKSKVSLGKIELKFGTQINLDVEKLNIVHASGPLIELQSFVVKIPIFSILLGSGSIDIKIENPVVNYKELKEGNNWDLAMGQKKKETSPSSGAVTMSVPVFLTGTKVNLNITGINLNYNLLAGDQGALKINKFLIKNLNLKEPTAFEMNSNFSQKEMSLNALIIGEAHLQNLVKGKDLFSSIFITLSNIKASALKKEISEVKLHLNTTQDKKDHLSGDLEFNMGEGVTLKSNYLFSNGNLKLTLMKGDISIKDLLSQLGESAPSDISLDRTVFNINGDLDILKNNRIKPNLKFSLSPSLNFDLNGIKGNYGLEGSYRGKKLTLNGKGEVLQGEIKTNLNGDFDIMQLKGGVSKIAPMSVSIWVKGISFTREMIRETLYAKKEETKGEAMKSSETKRSSPSETATSLPILPQLRLDMFLDSIKIDNQDFSGKFRLITSFQKAILKDFDFNFSQGRGLLDVISEFKPGGLDNQISFKLTNLNLQGLNVFLPDTLSGIEGTFNGMVKGSVFSGDNKLNHDLYVDVKAYNGKIKGLPIKEKLQGMIDNIPVLKDKKIKLPEKLDGEFKRLDLKGRFASAKYSLNSFDFQGPDNTVDFKGDGQIFPLPNSLQGKIYINLKDKTGKIGPLLKRNTGTDMLPIRLTGYQFNLNPDYDYTIAQLAKGAVKQQTAKAKNKAKEKLKKTIEEKAGDLLKNKEVKKIFKGFFGK